jgi:hypothetical protein
MQTKIIQWDFDAVEEDKVLIFSCKGHYDN